MAIVRTMLTQMLRRATALCFVLAAVISAQPARADDGTESVMAELLRRVAKLETDNAYLKAQVETLESRVSSGGGGGGGSPSAGAPAAASGGMPVMCFSGVTLQQADPSVPQQIQQLQSDADAAEQQAESLQSQIGQMMDQSAQSGDGTSNNVTMGQRLALRQQMAAQYDQMTRKRAEAKKLQQQMANPPQIVTGWDGQRTVVLVVDPQFASVVNNLNPGDFVAWRGNRSKLTDTTSQYDRVWALQKSTRPAGYQDPPGGNAPN